MGGHAYGSVYGGPVGAVLTPALQGHRAAYHLPEASSLCGACQEVCPVRIPLPTLLRHWREEAHTGRSSPSIARLGLAVWAVFAGRPRLYRALVRASSLVLRTLGARRGRLRSLPFAGGWTCGRDLPVPQSRPFLDQWRAR